MLHWIGNKWYAYTLLFEVPFCDAYSANSLTAVGLSPLTVYVIPKDWRPEHVVAVISHMSSPLVQGAFYVLPEVSSFFGPGAEAQGFGSVPDADTLCMYLIQKAHVSGLGMCMLFSWCSCSSTLHVC